MAPGAGYGSVPLTRRAGGPDLARGFALLGIALANTIGWLHGSQWTILLKQLDATALDRAVDVLIGLTVDNRGFPLFAMLFGYGIGMLYRRSRARHERTGHFVLRMLRRHVALLAIGVAHAILLFSGDILVAYAMVGMFCVLLVTRHRVVLPLAAVIALPALGVWGWVDGTIGLSRADGYATASAPDYLTSLALRTDEAGAEVATTLLTDIGLLTPMAIGAIAARLRLFEEVAANRDVLVPIARWGLGIGVLGAVPLVAVLVIDPAHQHLDSRIVLGCLGVLHQYTGLVGALGFAAAAALVSDQVRRRRPGSGRTGSGRTGCGLAAGAVHGIEALGAVSLSAYVGQSILFLALFPPYALDLGAQLGSAGAAAIVVAGWLAMIPFAVALKRRGRRGPLEVVLRALAGSATPRDGQQLPSIPHPPRRPPMTVYADTPRWPRHGTLWGHLISDTSLAELHQVAARAQLPPRSFDLDHYDWPEAMQSHLVEAGARLVDNRELTRLLLRSGLRIRLVDRPAARARRSAEQAAQLGLDAVPRDLIVGLLGHVDPLPPRADAAAGAFRMTRDDPTAPARIEAHEETGHRAAARCLAHLDALARAAGGPGFVGQVLVDGR